VLASVVVVWRWPPDDVAEVPFCPVTFDERTDDIT